MKKILLVAYLACLVGCQIKAPDNGGDIGVEVKEADVLSSLQDIFKGYTVEQAFRKEDWGKVQIIDKSMANQVVRQTHEFKVTDVTDTEVVYEEYIVETNEGFRYTLQKQAPPPQGSNKVQGPAGLFVRLMYLVNNLSFEKTSAHAEDIGLVISPDQIKTQMFNILSFGEGKFYSPLNIGSMSFSDFKTMEDSSKYFGLKLHKHKLVTSNCAQFTDCKINAVNVTFNQIKKNNAGVDTRYHHEYEFSTEVPGIFSPLSGHRLVNAVEFCISTLVVNGDAQIPFTRCVHLQDFKLGTSQSNTAAVKSYKLGQPVVTQLKK